MANIILGSVPESIQNICGTQGKENGIKGGKRTTDPNEYLIAYDMTKKEFRNIFYNSIQKIVANKKTYFVNVIDTKNYRFGLIERVANENDNKISK
jgi:hypothetical protein